MTRAEKLTAIAENEQKVYDAGYQGGKKEENEEFWDDYQQNGTRTGYGYAFGGWTDGTFRPRYDMKPTNCTYMFAKSFITSLTDALERAGVTLDTSEATNHIGMFFESAYTTEIPHIDLRKSLYATNLFNYCTQLKSVEITVAENTVPNYSNWFNRCDSLQNLKVNGVIDKNGMNLQHSTKLSNDSIVSVINALSATTSGFAVTLSKAAVNKAFETIEGMNDGTTSAEWALLIATRSNWTISLV